MQVETKCPETDTLRKKEDNPASTTPFVLGILSLVFTFCCQLAGLVLGIVGLVKASKLKALGVRDSKVESGWIMSLIGLILSSIILLIVLFYIVVAAVFLFGDIYW